LNEKRNIPIKEAQKLGAMALFGEKYGDTVRMIQFGDSIELCGGTHAPNTGKIGLFKLTSEGAVAAGVRRIEAITGPNAEAYFRDCDTQINQLKQLLKNPKGIVDGVENLIQKNQTLQNEIDALKKAQAQQVKVGLKEKITKENGYHALFETVDLDANSIKDILFQLKGEFESFVGILGGRDGEKCSINILFTDNLVKEKQWNAGNLIRSAAKHIQGGGGGQPFFATAGGKNPSGIAAAIQEVKEALV
jgi:alanyl-tRNA synthetase